MLATLRADSPYVFDPVRALDQPLKCLKVQVALLPVELRECLISGARGARGVYEPQKQFALNRPAENPVAHEEANGDCVAQELG